MRQSRTLRHPKQCNVRIHLTHPEGRGVEKPHIRPFSVTKKSLHFHRLELSLHIHKGHNYPAESKYHSLSQVEKALRGIKFLADATAVNVPPQVCGC